MQQNKHEVITFLKQQRHYLWASTIIMIAVMLFLPSLLYVQFLKVNDAVWK